MGVIVVVSYILLFILVDVIVTTVLYLHGCQTAIFTEDVQNFDILHSVLDLWGTMLVRVCLLLGASIGVLWNRVDGPCRVSALGTLTLLICLTISTYASAKLLILSEQGNLSHQPWFLSLFSWTCVSALGTVLLWRLLGRTPNTVTEGEGGGGGGGHGGSEETERLVETAGENGTEEVEEQGQEHGGKKRRRASRKGTQDQTDSGATMGRLLSYCSKDAGLLSVAVLFLLISAVCE